MIIVTGLSVTRRTWFRIASPLFGSLVSTSTTPAWVTNTVVFPPAPGITYRLSRTFLIAPVGGMRGRCCSARTPATARTTTASAGRSLLYAIDSSPPFVGAPAGIIGDVRLRLFDSQRLAWVHRRGTVRRNQCRAQRTGRQEQRRPGDRRRIGGRDAEQLRLDEPSEHTDARQRDRRPRSNHGDSVAKHEPPPGAHPGAPG